ncbi:Scn10a [Symbiodinium necroappetens]|uniref:Scn10a protein n=2 Tax=Symbiodinium TaxID=2949 RepID=A0A813A4N1_9DINO|nr:Sodium channel protein type 10 subunit alpha [Symbiodinium microadriaticum]CAE7255328.1 Scn10a [Symbiodinium microadriaticum]CAE7712819.1 Scn10a [Symbiodinium sp. KB8]CAE7849038.1 Scn10a [Symbiodinium necroappetens]
MIPCPTPASCAVLTGEKVAADQSFLSDLEQNRELISLHKELLAKHEQLFESMQAKSLAVLTKGRRAKTEEELVSGLVAYDVRPDSEQDEVVEAAETVRPSFHRVDTTGRPSFQRADTFDSLEEKLKMQEAEQTAFDLTGLQSMSLPHLRRHQSLLRQAAQYGGLVRKALSCAASAAKFLESVTEPPRTGFVATLLLSSFFQSISLGVIVLNAAWITVMTNYELSRPGEEVQQVLEVELAFSAFYLFEVLAKLYVHRFYFFRAQDRWWNIFDFFLVVTVLVEHLLTASASGSVSSGSGFDVMFLRLLRLCKLARILRIFRQLQFFQELRLMLECVAGSVVNAFWCVILLFFTKFIFALLLGQALVGYFADIARTEDITSEHSRELQSLFRNVFQTMITLLQATTGGIDWNEPYKALERTGWAMPVIFVMFILLFVVSIWNIVTSIFVEAALKAATPDFDAVVWEQTNQEKKLSQELIDVFVGRATYHGEDVGSISLEDFRPMAEDPRFRGYLSARGIDIKNVESFFNMLTSDKDKQEVDVRTLANACVRMKGFATSIDLLQMSFDMKTTFRQQTGLLRRFARSLRRMEDMMMDQSPRRGTSRLNVFTELGDLDDVASCNSPS